MGCSGSAPAAEPASAEPDVELRAKAIATVTAQLEAKVAAQQAQHEDEAAAWEVERAALEAKAAAWETERQQLLSQIKRLTAERSVMGAVGASASQPAMTRHAVEQKVTKNTTLRVIKDGHAVVPVLRVAEPVLRVVAVDDRAPLRRSIREAKM